MYSISNDVELPRRKTLGSAGYDFYMPYDLDLEPGEEYLVGTKICLDDQDCAYFVAEVDVGDGDDLKTVTIYPRQWSIKLYPRSSLGDQYGMRLVNTTGVIDRDYVDHQITAKITVTRPLSLKKGDRFMQGELTPVLHYTDEIEPTAKRTGGKGSTGLSDDVPAPVESENKTAVVQSAVSTALTTATPLLTSLLCSINKNVTPAEIQSIVSKTLTALNEQGVIDSIYETVSKQMKAE